MNGALPPNGSFPRLGSVQALRGIAAIMVVIAHASTYAAYGSGTSQGVLGSLAALGATGVDLFFVISGFVMALGIDQNPRPASTFVRDRFLRIVPLFWILSGLSFVLLLPGSSNNNALVLLNSITIVPLLDGATYHPPLLFVGWTLAFELSFYALVGLVLTTKWHGDHRLNGLMALILISAITGIFWQPQWAVARIMFNPLMLEFLFGIIAYRMWRSANWARRAPFLMVGGVFFVVVAMVNPFGLALSLNGHGAIQNGEGLKRSLMLGLPSALIFAGVVLDPSHRQSARRVFGVLGDASYSIYLTQVLVLGMIETAIAVGGLHSYVSIAALVIAGSVVAGLGVHLTIERPLIRFFKKKRDADGAACKQRRLPLQEPSSSL